MNIGQVVMLIGTDGYMPPMGAVGCIVSPIDEDGDYEVHFELYPCPVPPDVTWFAHSSWLIPLSGVTTRCENEHCVTV